MTHKQPAAFGSPVFHICGATHLPASPSFPFGHTEERRTEGRIAGIVKHGHYRSCLLLLGHTSVRTLDARTRAETDTWQRKLLDDDSETR